MRNISVVVYVCTSLNIFARALLHGKQCFSYVQKNVSKLGKIVAETLFPIIVTFVSCFPVRILCREYCLLLLGND